MVLEEENMEFIKWVCKDQLVMAWLFGSLTEKALLLLATFQFYLLVAQHMNEHGLRQSNILEVENM